MSGKSILNTVSEKIKRYYKADLLPFYKKIRLNYLLPFVVLCITLTITFFAWSYVKNEVEKDFTSYFNLRVHLTTNLIENRLSSFADVLEATRGLYIASESVSRDEFYLFIKALQPEVNYPGVQGIGFSLIVKPESLQNHIKEIRREGFPDYKIKPEGKRDIYTSIIYLEPFKDRNLRAFGFDMYSEAVRRKAMQTSCDSNKIVISGKVELVQETDQFKQPGFLMYLPVYKKHSKFETVEDRRKNIIGWVYSPFRMNDLMTNILGMNIQDIDVEIYDGTGTNGNALMYDSNPSYGNRDSSKMHFEKNINIGEHNWTVCINSTREMELRLDWRKPEYIGTIFGICSLMFVALTQLLVKGREKALAMSKTKDKFFSIISHDLRSPFNGFLNLTEIFAEQSEEFSKDELKSLGAELHKAAQNQYRLLNDLLNWAKLQKDNFVFNPATLNLFEEVNSVFAFYEIPAKQKGINLLNEVEGNISTYFDHDMLSVVLRNLISNSIKFTESGGYIKVQAKQNGNRVFVSVSDNGTGINPEDIVKLFRIDNRFTTLGTREEKGTGLGLTLCREIIERNGGKIIVESEPGKGSKFNFSLPA